MIEALVIAVVACIALAYVLSPLRRPRRDRGVPDTRAEQAGERRRAALNALVDLEEEHAIGKLSEADFEALRWEYEAEALAALKELDRIDGSHTSDEDLEAEIARIRKDLECPSCGALRNPGEPCGRCGAPA